MSDPALDMLRRSAIPQAFTTKAAIGITIAVALHRRMAIERWSVTERAPAYSK